MQPFPTKKNDGKGVNYLCRKNNCFHFGLSSVIQAGIRQDVLLVIHAIGTAGPTSVLQGSVLHKEVIKLPWCCTSSSSRMKCTVV